MANDDYPLYTPTRATESIVEQYDPYNTPSSSRQPSISPGYAPEVRHYTLSLPPDADVNSLYSGYKRPASQDYVPRARYTLGSGPLDVDANSPVYSGYKRPASQGTHSEIGQSEAWYAANPSKHPRFESSSPVYLSEPGDPDLKEMSTNVYPNVIGTSTFDFRSILHEEKLTGPNFLEWESKLRIILRSEEKLYVLEHPVPDHPPVDAPQCAIDACKKHSDDSRDVKYLMLGTMCPYLQDRCVKVDAYNMIRLLQNMFQEQYRIEQYETSQALYSCKMVEGESVSAHVTKMKRYIDYRERLGYPVVKELATDIILNSLSKDYKEFVINFDLNNMGLPFSELHEMLKRFEQRLILRNKYTADLMVRQDEENKNFDKGNSKIPAKKPNTKPNPKPKNKNKNKTKPEPPKPKFRPAKDDACHHCNTIGHWKRNCPLYLRELIDKKKADMANTSG